MVTDKKNKKKHFEASILASMNFKSDTPSYIIFKKNKKMHKQYMGSMLQSIEVRVSM